MAVQTAEEHIGIRPARAIVFSDIAVVATEERERLLGRRLSPDAQKMLDDARADAQRILADARRDGDALRDQARELGYREGFTSGYAEGRNAADEEAARERAALRSAVDSVVRNLESESARLWTEAEREVLAFAMGVARRILRDEITLQPEAVLSVIRGALRRVVDRQRVRIRVNPENLDIVKDAREELAAVLDGVEGVEVVSDRRVSEGGAIVETNGGVVDARIETQLEEIETMLSDAVLEAA